MLHELHWLNIKSRVAFKILLLTYKYIAGQFCDNINIEYKSFNFRPNDFLQLKLIFVKTSYGKRTLGYTAPRLWNNLPLEIRSAPSVDMFKQKLKTFLFVNTAYTKTALNW